MPRALFSSKRLLLYKVTDGYHKIKYLPTYKNYRSDIEKMRKKGLILVEKSDKLVIFKAEKQNEQLTLF